MGTLNNHKTKKMKLFATAAVVSVASAAWPSQYAPTPDVDPVANPEWTTGTWVEKCGEQFSFAPVNKTCTYNPNNYEAYKFLGGGAFISGPNQFFGVDGISSNDGDLVVFFDNTEEYCQHNCGTAPTTESTEVPTSMGTPSSPSALPPASSAMTFSSSPPQDSTTSWKPPTTTDRPRSPPTTSSSTELMNPRLSTSSLTDTTTPTPPRERPTLSTTSSTTTNSSTSTSKDPTVTVWLCSTSLASTVSSNTLASETHPANCATMNPPSTGMETLMPRILETSS